MGCTDEISCLALLLGFEYEMCPTDLCGESLAPSWQWYFWETRGALDSRDQLLEVEHWGWGVRSQVSVPPCYGVKVKCPSTDSACLNPDPQLVTHFMGVSGIFRGWGSDG